MLTGKERLNLIRAWALKLAAFEQKKLLSKLTHPK